MHKKQKLSLRKAKKPSQSSQLPTEAPQPCEAGAAGQNMCVEENEPLLECDLSFAKRGFPNLGNTCYMSSVLQVLSRCHVPIAHETQGVEAHARVAFSKVLEDVQAGGQANATSWGSFVDAMRTLHFGEGQQDVQEFLHYALEHVAPQLRYIFYSRLERRITCQECECFTRSGEDSLDFSISVKADELLLEAFERNFFHREFLRGENKFQCLECNLSMEAYRETRIAELPQVLAFYVKQPPGEPPRKVQTPLHITLQGVATEDCVDRNSQYELFGVVIHQRGNAETGHYVAAIQQADGSWAWCDDDRMDLLTLEEVWGTVPGERAGSCHLGQKRDAESKPAAPKMTTAMPQMLFYKREGPIAP